MAAWNITDQGAVSGLELGTPRAVVRASLGDHREFRRAGTGPESDQFRDAGVIATYDEDGRLALIELTEPAVATLHGVTLLGRDLVEVLRQFEGSSLSITRTIDGATFDEILVALYAPEGKVEGVAIGDA